ncbi:MAG TPA: DUF4286 family protein [Polyangia bacterium]|jgi:hypothetical protein|nr:DUF4286 family protein [Polyangia bacterium]
MILFQLHFDVADERRQEFEKTYNEVFEPAVSRQEGFKNAKLIRFYPPDQVREIEASPTQYNYQVNFVFESEALRRRWAATAEHDVAWPRLSGIARKFRWRGYDIIG